VPDSDSFPPAHLIECVPPTVIVLIIASTTRKVDVFGRMIMEIACPNCGKPTPTPADIRAINTTCVHCKGSIALDALPTMVPAPANEPAAASNSLEGQRLAGYQLVRLIGRGGMGEVYEAVQESLNRKVVAIKILPPGLAADTAFIKRFNRESGTLAQLSHPNIVAIYDRGHDAGHYFFVLEFVTGKAGGTADTLHRRLRSAIPLPTAECARLILQIAEALAYAHGQGVIHRDIKPSNVLLDARDNARLVDFGIARIMGIAGGNDITLTLTGEVLGTAGYLAPEQREGKAPADARVDVYSCGVLLYEMLTGRMPEGVFELPSEVVTGLDPAWDAVVEKSLQRNPDRRYQSMNVFLEAVRSVATAQFAPSRVEHPAVRPVERPASVPVPPPEIRRSDTTDSRLTPVMGKCVKCRTINPGDNRFCSECGSLLYETCPACKVENRVGTKFCGKCGVDVAKLNRVGRLRQQATELKQRAGQIPGQTVQLLTEARQKLQGILTESPTDETAQKELNQLDENLCAAFLKLARSTSGDEALAIYKRMLLVFPKHLEATAELARLEQALKSAIAKVKALIDAGNFSEAVKQAVQADKYSGPSAELQALQHRAEIGASLLEQIHTQQSAVALSACRKLLQTFPANKAARIRLQEIEQHLQELKSSASESIKAGDYKQAMFDLNKTLADLFWESELLGIAAKGEAGSITGGIENVLMEMATLREQAKSSQARLVELSDKLIPSLIQERKYVAVLGCLDELIQLGAGAEFVTETRAKATEEAQAAQAFAERGDQLLAAKKPRKAIKEFKNALERCADNQRAIKGREGAENSIAISGVIYSVVGIIAVIMLVEFGVSLVSAWQDRSAWAEAQQTVKIAGNDLEHIKQGYQKYLAAFPNGNHVSAAQQALAQAEHKAFYDSGVAKKAKGDLDGAISDFTKVIETAPNEADAYFNRGTAKAGNNDLDGALADYSKAIELEPAFADAYNNRGIAKNAKGDLDGAMADYDKAIEIKPQFADAYFDRGLVGEAKGNLDGAMADYNRAVELNPILANQNLLDRLKAEIEQKKLVEEKRRQLAQQEKDRLARMEQGRQAYNEGVTNEARGDLDGAMAEYNKAIELNSGIAMAYYKRANAKAGNKDFGGAIEDYDKFIEINPNEAPAYINRSRVMEAIDDIEGALADYHKAVELDSKLADNKWQQKLTDEISQQNAIADIAKAVETATNYAEVNLQKNKLINYWRGGELASAVTEAATLANEKAKSKDAILWWLERGAVLRATGLYADSNDAFDMAQLKIDAIWSWTGAQPVSNIQATPNQANLDYEGRSYDGIMLNTYKALNYLALGLPDNARPELIRAYQRQQDAVDDNKRRIEKTQEEAAKSKDKTGINDLKVYADYVNPFTVYLDGLYFLFNAADASDLNRAHKGFERVTAFAPDNEYVKQDLATVDGIINGKPLTPVTYVIFETGCAPERSQIRIDIPINVSKVSHASAAFPTLKLQDNFARSLTVTADGTNFTTELVANMDNIITRNYKDNLPVTISKTVNDATLGRPVNIADTRTWATLPREFQVARIPTPANRRILLTTPDGMKYHMIIDVGYVNVVYVKSIKARTPLLVSQFKLK
jgi:serine/threonine protein kinase/Flp pilus assembly protein TadD